MSPLACRIAPPIPDRPFILVHTDGSCLGNPGPGGWAAVLRRIEADGREAKRRAVTGSEPYTTNNRMELQAAIEALRALKRSVLAVVVVSDSAYMRGGITTWMPNWKANGWRTAGRKPVRNRELWEELDEITRTQRVDWRWTKGHAGDLMNEEVDRLAKNAAAVELKADCNCY